MAPGRRIIPALLMLAVAASAVSTVTGPSHTERLQAALEALAEKDLILAEAIAAPLLDDAPHPCPRAWLIAAAARQRRGRHGPAAEAYRRFLALSKDPAERTFAMRQVRRCGSAGRAARPALPISKRLSAEQFTRLAIVEDRPTIESSEHFVVRAYNPHLAKRVVAEAEAALRRICRVILPGVDYPHTVEVYVWPTLAEYGRNATTAAEWSGGSFSFTRRADGLWVRRIDLTQLNANRQFDTDVLDRVLPHEMCHLVQSEFFGDARSPLVLNEGLAMMAEATVHNARVRLAGTALAGEGKIPVPMLLAMETVRRDDAAVFYAEAFSFVSYIHARITAEQFREMLAHVKAGCPLEEALQRALYVPCRPGFLTRLTRAWEHDALRQSQILRALDAAATTTQ